MPLSAKTEPCEPAAEAARLQVAQFAESLFEPDDIVELRRVPSRRSSFHVARELAGVAGRLVKENNADQNIYAGINPRRATGGRRSEDVLLARCLFADWDGIDLAEARRRWEAAGMPEPTLKINSGHGVHAYWRLTEPISDLIRWSSLQKLLIAKVQSDDKIHDPPRIMRLPGFLNLKAEPVACEVLA